MTGCKDLDLARAAAEEAGEILIKYWKGRGDLVAAQKAPGEFVSEADIAAEQHLRRRLLAQCEDGWLGEETGLAPAENGRVWIVDPLDGTTNFLRGVPVWAVSIALEIDGQRVMGVVHDPIHGETFAAARGGAVTVNGRPADVSDTAQLDGALFGTGIPFGTLPNIDDHAAEIARLMPHCAGVRRMGAAALDLAYVAAGRLDGFWERRLQPWDVAAGLVLLRASGARVEGLDPAEQPEKTGSILAGAPGVFKPFADLIRSGDIRENPKQAANR